VLLLGDRVLEVLVEEDVRGFNLQIAGSIYEVETVRARARGRDENAASFEEGKWVLRAPLTGVVIEIRVAPGDKVEQNDVLIIVEAMKMLNELRARVGGEVAVVHVAERDRVEISARLIEIAASVDETATEPQ
jgi:biotin carboxyl carrier protein